MKFYFAPMEGITGYIYRNVYHNTFGEVDKYFSPFICPNQSGKLTPKEKRDILPENNQNLYLVPQILTNDAEGFLKTEKALADYGYQEINLNLGCPSKTVVSKRKGSGFLAYPEELDYFLDKIFSKTNCRISIKTRVGKESGEEFYRLLEIFNKYPMEELIIHPRAQSDYYKNTPKKELFRYAADNSELALCYNGDIFGIAAYEKWENMFPGQDSLMLGRGLLINPGLIGLLKTGKMPQKEKIREYHDNLYDAYKDVLYGDKVILYKMKELWFYLIRSFDDSKKYGKKIKKVEKLAVYDEIIQDLFENCELIPFEEEVFRIN